MMGEKRRRSRRLMIMIIIMMIIIITIIITKHRSKGCKVQWDVHYDRDVWFV